MSKAITSLIVVLLLLVTGFLIAILIFNNYNFQFSESEKLGTNTNKSSLVLIQPDSLSSGKIISNEDSVYNITRERDLCDEYGFCEDRDRRYRKEECRKNSDCDEDYESENYCYNGEVYKDSIDYSCEKRSCKKDTAKELIETCEFGCSDGACLISDCKDNDNDNYDSCSSGDIGDDGKPIDCNDNDINVNPGALEICNGVDDDCDGLIDEGDVCVTECNDLLDNDNDNLVDALDPGCWDDINDPNTYNENLDNESRATSICSFDSDCDDNNDYTSDKCINSGTGSSYCSYEDIVCLQDSDCGFDDFIGNRSCINRDGDRDGDVWEDFKDYRCNNPGTSSSECSFEIYKKLSDACSIGCYNGECITEICDNGFDDDGDGLIDGLVELDENNEIKENIITRNPGALPGIVYQALEFYNFIYKGNLITNPPVSEAMLLAFGPDWTNPDVHPTSEKICNILGYANVDSVSCDSDSGAGCNWWSPEDNYHWYWNGNDFVKYDSKEGSYKYMESWIGSLSCINKLSVCNNGFDDDGDGKTDYCDGTNPDTCDNGCASEWDDSEVGHDIECVLGYFK